jgi:hypothetical protein
MIRFLLKDSTEVTSLKSVPICSQTQTHHTSSRVIVGKDCFQRGLPLQVSNPSDPSLASLLGKPHTRPLEQHHMKFEPECSEPNIDHFGVPANAPPQPLTSSSAASCLERAVCDRPGRPRFLA